MSAVHWLLELEIQAGQSEEFKMLMNQMVETVQLNEPGALSYEWSTNPEGTICHIYERYADDKAVMTHLTGFRQFAERFMRSLKPIRFTVYGSPGEQVKEALAAFNPTFMEPAAGFSR